MKDGDCCGSRGAARMRCGAPPAASPGAAAAGRRCESSAACEALRDLPNLTITTAKVVAADGETPSYCYVRGTIPPGIAYHVQLPLPDNWNGRFLKYGDGTKDGDLDYADHRLAEGYAVANSNMGHDAGAEPGAWFAFDNRQAEIDFGYRAVHLTANAGKAVVAPTTSVPRRVRTSKAARRAAAKGSSKRSVFRTTSTASSPAHPCSCIRS